MVIQIPLEYQDRLEPIENGDKRTDDEILSTLLEYQPVTSEKNIWTFWDSGIHGMPGWCRRNVIGWVRICGPEWTIRVLDSNTESPNYAGKYIPKGLPDAFYNNTMDGSHSGPHSADFLRGACLYEYGGAWADSSIFLLRTMDEICWNQLEDPTSPYRVAVPVIYANLLNCFLAARKHDPFIKRWHDIFMHVWEGRSNPDGLAKHPLLAPIAPHFVESLRSQMIDNMGLTVPLEKVVEYACQMVCWLRVCMLEDIGDGFSGADYWAQNVLWMNTPLEVVRAFYFEGTETPAFTRGQEIFDQLSTKRDEATDSAEYKAAEKMVWTQLTETSMMKIGTIKGMVDWVSLGTLWNKPENLGKDSAPGTFGELLRYIPLHFRQTREGIYAREAKRAPVTIRKGVLEP
ncbi:hypothetical protein E0Z10_g7131 [Xylaria hypoxylon]|uniref:Capsule polysaccharide biosynthesis protein n=1 Tax=Xylaria hypoxylon TaxID=37992 RepID=A0A4Z0YR61_9PEZI|nr:hypothetical protein E0Z10_g7131 [Xylaria hypoxylon]